MADLLTESSTGKAPHLTWSEHHRELALQLRADYAAPAARRLAPTIGAALAIALVVILASTSGPSPDSPAYAAEAEVAAGNPCPPAEVTVREPESDAFGIFAFGTETGCQPRLASRPFQ